MISPDALENRAVRPSTLTDRQQQVATLVAQYVAAAHEWPSAAWLSRRLNISRKRAWEHLRTFRLRAGIIRR